MARVASPGTSCVATKNKNNNENDNAWDGVRLRSATNAETTHQAQLTSETLTRNSFGEERACAW